MVGGASVGVEALASLFGGVVITETFTGLCETEPETELFPGL